MSVFVEIPLSWEYAHAAMRRLSIDLGGRFVSSGEVKHSVVLPIIDLDVMAVRDWLHDHEKVPSYKMFGITSVAEGFWGNTKFIDGLRFQFSNDNAAIYFKVRWLGL